MEDLNSHESEEEDWKATSPSKVAKKSPKMPSPLTKSKRLECQKHSNMKVDFEINQAASKISSDNMVPSLIKIEHNAVLKTRTENDGNVRPKREIKSPKKYADFIATTGQEKIQTISKNLFSNEEDMVEIHDIIDVKSSESWNIGQSPFLCLEKEENKLIDKGQNSLTSNEGEEISKFQGTSIKVEADDELFAIKTEKIDEQIFQEKVNFKETIGETIGDSIDVLDNTIVVKDELLEENINQEEARSEKTHYFNSEISDKVKVEPKSEQNENIIQIKDVYSEFVAENSNMKKGQSSIHSTSQIPCYDVPDSDQENEDDDIPDDIG